MFSSQFAEEKLIYFRAEHCRNRTMIGCTLPCALCEKLPHPGSVSPDFCLMR